MSYGHLAENFGHWHVDKWGDGPFWIRVEKVRYKFEDSDMFGPVLLTKAGDPKTNQPLDKHPFWAAYYMWRQGGRCLKCGKVCIYEKPRSGTYWKDKRGISHFITHPNFDDMGYRKVPKPPD